MITRLIWTTWTPMSSVPKKADQLNLSLLLRVSLLAFFSCFSQSLLTVSSVVFYLKKRETAASSDWVYSEQDRKQLFSSGARTERGTICEIENVSAEQAPGLLSTCTYSWVSSTEQARSKDIENGPWCWLACTKWYWDSVHGEVLMTMYLSKFFSNPGPLFIK